MSDFYSIEQVAERLGVHVRTVRNFIRDGRLSAIRIGKQYRIAADDLAKLTGRPAASFAPRRTRHVEVSGIVEIDAIDPQTTSRITNMLMAAANSRDGSGPAMRIETIYDEERARLKVIVVGGIDDTCAMLKAIQAVTEP
jgi:excisionase family DNA binding protein